MSALPLELHEVLEQEYLSMYGPLKNPPAGDLTVTDDAWAQRILQECGLSAADGETPEQRLERIVAEDEDLEPLRNSPALTDRGRYLLDHYSKGDGKEARRKIVDEAFTGAVKPLREVRLENVYRAIHTRRAENKPRTALCISGGGIRSATFALGVMQALASVKLLDKFDYLSTVSGGGYIGSWLSSWVRRHRDGVTGVQESLCTVDNPPPLPPKNYVPMDPAPPVTVPERKIYPEPAPLRHLRAFSNYLSPSLSIFSGDTWSIASLYLRNLLLNLLVLVPLLALALAVPRIFSWMLGDSSRWIEPGAWAWVAAGLTTYGFAYLGIKRPVQQGRNARLTATTDGWFVVNCVLPLTGAAAALAVFYARYKNGRPELVSSSWAKGALLLAVAGMTIVPYLLYYSRVWTASAAERRTSFHQGKVHLAKQLNELFAVVVSVATSAALLLLLAYKVFDDPIRKVSDAATLAPIDRVNLVTSPQAQLYLCFAIPLVLLVFFVQASIFVGLSGKKNEDYDREWWGRAGGWLIAFSVILAVFNVIAVFGPIAFYYAPAILGAIGGGAGAGAAMYGYSDKSSKKKEEESTASKASGIASKLAVPIFIAALLAAISLGTTWLTQELDSTVENAIVHADQFKEAAVLQATFTRFEPPINARGGVQKLETEKTPRASMPELRSTAHLQTVQLTSFSHVLVFLGVGLSAVLLSLFIGVNKFSMAALYRNRIIRAYLGASRYNRDPDHFTGFDENDNVQMWELRPELLWATNFKDPVGLVNAMLKNEDKPGKLFALFDSSTQGLINPRYQWQYRLVPDKWKPEVKPVKTVDAATLDALVQNINALLMNGDLAAGLGVDEPAWVKRPADDYFELPRSIRNRAVLDANFAAWINVMAALADIPNAPKATGARAPLHVVNTALNLTTDDNLAWQQRMASSFSVSPLHCGNLGLGYRPAEKYAGGDGISLGTAVTISGAAASPNMGYHSSPTLAFLLTFFNIRLGSWLGNPGPRGDSSYDRAHPHSGLIPLLAELTGNSNDKSKWVYLSDGGHFENLGLYEMVVRRCHEIVLSDGGADPKCTFEDLGNAIRKIRIDLGIPIEIERIDYMHPRSKSGKPVLGDYVLTARIRYDAVDAGARPGRITYVKPGVYKGDYFPVDVYNYAMGSPEFPHEPTSDQFFSESQFESYRTLGRHAIDILYVDADAGRGARIPIAKPKNVYEFNQHVAERKSLQDQP